MADAESFHWFGGESGPAIRTAWSKNQEGIEQSMTVSMNMGTLTVPVLTVRPVAGGVALKRCGSRFDREDWSPRGFEELFQRGKEGMPVSIQRAVNLLREKSGFTEEEETGAAIGKRKRSRGAAAIMMMTGLDWYLNELVEQADLYTVLENREYIRRRLLEQMESTRSRIAAGQTVERGELIDFNRAVLEIVFGDAITNRQFIEPTPGFVLPIEGTLESAALLRDDVHEESMRLRLQITTTSRADGLTTRRIYDWPCVVMNLGMNIEFTVNVSFDPRVSKVAEREETFRTYDDTVLRLTGEASHGAESPAPTEMSMALIPLTGSAAGIGQARAGQGAAAQELHRAILSDLSLLAWTTGRGIPLPGSVISIDIAAEMPMQVWGTQMSLYPYLEYYTIDIDNRRIILRIVQQNMRAQATEYQPVSMDESFAPGLTRLADMMVIDPVSGEKLLLVDFIYKVCIRQDCPFREWITRDMVADRLRSFEFGFALYQDMRTGMVDLSLSHREIGIGISPSGAVAAGQTAMPLRPQNWKNVKVVAKGHSHGCIHRGQVSTSEDLLVSQADVQSLMIDNLGEAKFPHVLLELPEEESPFALAHIYGFTDLGLQYLTKMAKQKMHPALVAQDLQKRAQYVWKHRKKYLYWSSHRLPMPGGIEIMDGALVVLPPVPTSGLPTSRLQASLTAGV